MLSKNGAAVAIFDLDEERGQSVAKSLRKGLYCKVDVSNEDSVKAGFQSVREAWGRLDIVVNCAGIVGPNAIKTEDVATPAFDKVYEGRSILECRASETFSAFFSERAWQLSCDQILFTGDEEEQLWTHTPHCLHCRKGGIVDINMLREDLGPLLFKPHPLIAWAHP